jgi:hypothetical protein
MIAHTFNVSNDGGDTTTEITVNIPTFDEMTVAQRQNLVAEGYKSVTIKAQGTLRRRQSKGIRGKALEAEAQAAFDAIINGTRTTAPKLIIDATEMMLTREQIDLMVSKGATVVNIPPELAGIEVSDDEDTDDEA